MKNYLALVLALSVVTSPAFASRARLESLGEEKNGSYYIDDSRNIFLNPAQIVHYKKKLFLETGVDNVSMQDVPVTGNRAEGGFTNTFGDFTYGIYMNQTSEHTLGIVQGANGLSASAAGQAAGAAAAATAATAPGATAATITAASTAAANAAAANAMANGFIAPDSTIEAFFAGEGSLNWGISLFYAGNEQKGTITPIGSTAGVDRTASQLGARVGIDANNLQVFATVGILSKSTIYSAGNPELKGKVGVNGGLSYRMNDMTAFGKVIIIGADQNVGGTTVAQVRENQYGLGLGWKREMTKSTNLYARLEGDYQKIGVNNNDTKTWNIPAVVAAEAQALSWLTIRGSIAESLLGQQWAPGARNSLGGTTTVSLGTGLTFGDVQIDGLVATNGANNPAGGIAGFGTAPQTNTGFGFGDNMITRVALTYNF